MRQAYALLGLVKRWGPGRVEAACRRALDAEAIGLIGRMLDRATENTPANQPTTAPAGPAAPARFAGNRRPRNAPVVMSHYIATV